MFVGALDQDKKEITDIMLLLFTTAMFSAADALESFELYGQIKNVNRALEKSVKKLKKSEGELKQHRRHLESLVSERTEALKKSEERYRSIFENSVEGIFQTASNGRFISINPAFARMHGYGSPQEMIDDNQAPHKPGAFIERRKDFMRLIEEDGFVVNFETRMFQKDNRLAWVSINARVVRDERGNIQRWEGAVMDISDKKMLEAQLLQAQKMEAVGRLAGGVAHDFNNILMALMGYGNLLQMKMDPKSPLHNYVDQIISCTVKASKLTQSLLAFGRKQMMELKPYRVEDLLKDTQKLLERLLPEDIDLRLFTGDSDESVMADATQIGQVLLNLATNARDAMPEGGKLTIETSRVEVDGEFIRTHGYGKPGGYILISVKDTGAGIDEKIKERIFEPFFTTKEVGKGTGLGLSIVYGIVHQHGGFIVVESEVNAGTAFLVYLPLIERQVPNRQRTTAHIRGGTETILFAEDNPDIRNIAGEILGMYGYTVLEAEDGEDAIRKFREYQHLIDLLILDVVMPIKNGKEAYDEIKELKQDVRAIFVSGYTGDIVLNKGIRGEAFDFVPKPISPNNLLLKVREVLDRQSA